MAVGFQASDLFALGANFHEQSSSSIDMDDRANIMDKDGNVECETMVNGRVEYTNEFAYCNASPDIKTDLSTQLTQFGDVFDSKKMTQMTVTFTAGAYATVSITGHQHDDNAHTSAVADGYADVSAALPSGAGFGVPTLTGQTLGNDAQPQSLTITFSCNHVDREGGDGTHFVGKNITVLAELTEEFVGTPDTATATGWTTDTKGPSDQNQDFDTYTYTAHRYFDLAT